MIDDDYPLKQVIVLLGPPGAGKGTQCTKLSKALRLPHISTGDLLRDCARGSSRTSQQISDFLSGGALVPDSLVMEMLEDRTAQADCDRGFILDGFPRTEQQARLLDAHLSSKNIPSQLRVLRLVVPDSVLRSRLSSRLLCPKCGAAYTRLGRDTDQFRNCEIDGYELVVREDDAASTARARLRIYEEQVPTILSYYNRRTTVIDIDGNRGIDEVAADLLLANTSCLVSPACDLGSTVKSTQALVSEVMEDEVR
jgi:adenylate kinase